MNYTKQQILKAIENVYWVGVTDGHKQIHLKKMPSINPEDYLPKEETKSITKWEYYKCFETDYQALDEQGRDGWELVAVSDRIAFFKRPIN